MLMQPGTGKAVMGILLFCTLSIDLLGQPEKNKESGTNQIEGQILDIYNNPLEYANVILLRMPDSLVVNGTVTDPHGFFLFEHPPVKKFILKIQLIGYSSYLSPVIVNPDRNKNTTLDPIHLTPSSRELKEVEITGNRQPVTQQIDKKVIDVQKDLDAAAGNAIDILAKSPAISVDADKNVSIRGRSDITVLIDGKPSTLKGSDALSAISASQIDKIEIITNPSAKYEAQGIGGIINVITKKGAIDGLEDLTNVTVGWYEKLKAETNFNYRKGILTFNGQIKYDDFTYLVQSSRFREIYNSRTDSLYQDNFNRQQPHIDNDIKGGVGIKLPKFSAGLDGKIGYFQLGKRKNGYQDTWTETLSNNTITSSNFEYSNTIYSSNIIWHYVDLDGNLNFIFNKPTHKLETLIHYSYGQDYTGYETDNWSANDQQVSMGSPNKIITGQNGTGKEFRIQSDYTNPLNEQITLESGLFTDMNYEKEKYYYQYFDTIANRWSDTGAFRDIMREKNNIYAAYLNIKEKSGKVEFQAGLRLEYNFRDISLNTDLPDIVIKTLQLFPSVSASYAINNSQKLFLAYSRRINRPFPWLLIPFVQLNDEYTSTIGNPGLQAEINNNLELGLEQRWKTLQITLNAYSRVINHGINQINIQTAGYNYLYTFMNLNQQWLNGIELHLGESCWNVLDITVNASLFSNIFQGTYNDSYLSQYGIKLSNTVPDTFDNHSFSWNANATLGIRLAPSTKFQVFGNYNSIMKQPQGEDLPSYFINASFQQELFKKKLKVNLSVDDVFNTERLSGIVIDYSNNYAIYRWWRKRFVLLSLTYNINNYKTENKKVLDTEKGGF